MDLSGQQSQDSSPTAGWTGALLNWFGPVEPHAHQGPFTRWPRITDGVLALLVFAGSVLSVTLSALSEGEAYTLDRISDLGAGSVVLLAIASVALLWRRNNPVVVAIAVLVTMALWAIAGYGDGNDLALIAAMYAVGLYTTNSRHSALVLVAAIAVSILGTIVDSNQRVDIAPALILPALAWYVGRRVRNRGEYLALLRERSERLEADQRARAREAVAAERSRIARELHDVVAHQVSMMTVQAGAARTIARDDPDTAINAMGDVEQAGRQALGELRHLLGVLRTDKADQDKADQDKAGPDDLGPQPGLAEIPALAEQLTHTGADVAFKTSDLPDSVPASVELSAYRIVQESITNIIKHAGTNPKVSITLGVDRGSLAMEITNTIIPSTTVPSTGGLPRSGYGIAGMKERADLLGGNLTAEPVPPNLFSVTARLPLDPEQP